MPTCVIEIPSIAYDCPVRRAGDYKEGPSFSVQLVTGHIPRPNARLDIEFRLDGKPCCCGLFMMPFLSKIKEKYFERPNGSMLGFFHTVADSLESLLYSGELAKHLKPYEEAQIPLQKGEGIRKEPGVDIFAKEPKVDIFAKDLLTQKVRQDLANGPDLKPQEPKSDLPEPTTNAVMWQTCFLEATEQTDKGESR